ncbi:MAG: nicotinate phosphoribosyltransferase [Cyanobacteria bacterium P01_E01_bin.6]
MTTFIQPDQEALSLNLASDDYGMLTDLYQLKMAACYVGEGLDQRPASFELFVRRLPDQFGYLIAMGLEQVLDYLDHFRFNSGHVDTLKATGLFEHAPDAFWELLQRASFSGDVWAVPEGTAIFAHEPLLRIEAPLWQAQIVETYVLNTLNYQTLIATRAARLRDVAGEEARLLEFGTRRAFSPQASIWAARAAIAGGLDATSNVFAALQLGQLPSGTMAHALVMALSALEGSEDDAFHAFHRYFPNAALLIDTYDSIAAARRLAEQVQSGDMSVPAVRLDSGDLVAQSKQVRSLLPDARIFASGDLDEAEIMRLRHEGACIDGYGIGTKLVTGQPVNGVYKLVDIDGIPTMKASSGKMTYPGRKQIFRRRNLDGIVQGDRLGLMTEMTSVAASLPGQSASEFPLEELPLLKQVMKNGQRVSEPETPETIEAIAQRTRQSVNTLPMAVRSIQHPRELSVQPSKALQALTQQTQHRIQTHTLMGDRA